MPSVCHDSSFVTINGELTLARAGAFRPLAVAHQPSSSDGPFQSHPNPGKTCIDIDTTWVNTTGVPHIAAAWVDRAPWTIIATNVQQARFQERSSYAVGVNAHAPTPPPVVDSFQSSMENWGTWFLWWQTTAARATVSYAAQDRGNVMLTPVVRVEPGQAFNFRYRVALITDFAPVAGGTPKSEAYARSAQAIIWGGPANQ